MEDFQGKYNGKQIDQLLDKANDIDLTKYALKTDNAPTATKLQAARTIALSGAVTGSVSSDFGGNVTISTTLANFDASKIASGTISIDRLPKAALERLVVVANDTARFALTTATAQSGDTVKVTSTGKMYLIKDESKLNSEDGYEPYTASQASSVPWSGVTGKPSTFTPPTSSATVLGGIKVGYTTSGKNYKVQLDSSGNAYVNVPWTDNNTTYNEATADTLGLVKIGYASNGKNYAVLLANGKMYVNVPWTDSNTTYTQATSDNLGLVKIGYSANGKNYPVALDGNGKMYVNVPWTDTNTTYSNMGAATSSAAGKAGLVPAPAAGAQGKYLRGDGTWQTPPNTTYSNMGGATSSAAGSAGLVPAPAAGKQASFLRGDGTWVVPTNTTYAKANTTTLGLVMIGYSENGKNYPVELDGSGKMYVNVPWTDTNTTYGVVGANGSTGLVKNGSTVTSASGYIACPIVSGVPYYKDTNTTYANMKAATSSAAGKAGLVPAPAAGAQGKYLRGDGTWQTPPNTTYSNMGGATSSAAGSAGLVPAPAAGKQASFLRGDGTWVVPTNTTYAKANTTTLGLVMIGYSENGKNYPVELDGSGKMYVNVPWTDTNTTYGVVGANGSTGLVKNGSTVTSASGYIACPIVSGVPYYKDTNTTYANMKAATASAAGAAGLVPAPAAGKQTSFLRGDGTWVVPTNTTYGLASTTANGLLRQLNGSTSSFMRGDGTWATPPNTTYAVANESTNGLMAAADKKTMNRLIGVNTVTTLANLPISKRSITATLSAATTLSVASGMQVGEELMIRCVPSAAFTQAIPNSGNYVSMSGTSITTTANKPFEINIWCYASGKYSIAVKEQD